MKSLTDPYWTFIGGVKKFSDSIMSPESVNVIMFMHVDFLCDALLVLKLTELLFKLLNHISTLVA